MFKEANQSVMQRQILVILQKDLHCKAMNNKRPKIIQNCKECVRLLCIIKNCSIFSIHLLKSAEFFKKEKGSEEHMLLQCYQQMVYLLTDPASKFFPSQHKYFHCTEYSVR
jgi:hypothetical protein